MASLGDNHVFVVLYHNLLNYLASPIVKNN